MTVILDYGINNLRSVEKAVEHLGFACRIQADIQGATKLILPGVGAFGKAMERIAPLSGEIRRFAEGGGPLLGICLGQQLLFESSEEFGETEGLGLIPGKVKYLPTGMGLKVPHIGWSEVKFNAGIQLGDGIPHHSRMYFVHSLYTACEDPSDIAATTVYGVEFPAAVARGNVWGAQFHPEKSGDVGLKVLENFLSC